MHFVSFGRSFHARIVDGKKEFSKRSGPRITMPP